MVFHFMQLKHPLYFFVKNNFYNALMHLLLDNRKPSSSSLKYLNHLRKLLEFDAYFYFIMRVNKYFPSEQGAEINKCLFPR